MAAPTAVEPISLVAGLPDIATGLDKKAGTVAASLDVKVVRGMLLVAGTLVAGKLLEEGSESAGMLPVAGTLVAGTLLTDVSRLLEEGNESAA